MLEWFIGDTREVVVGRNNGGKAIIAFVRGYGI